MSELQLNTIVEGNALSVLRTFPDESIDCVITSPPYWKQRDYDGIEGQLGQEKNVREYIDNLCSVFDEVHRVLKSSGTCWVNIGDKYQKKSLCLIPQRFCIEMQDRGWIVRNDIIWNKPDAVPESVKDRFTIDHEPLFFFTKSRRYYFEQQFEPRKTDPENDVKSYQKNYDKEKRSRLKPNTAYTTHGGNKSPAEMLETFKKGRNVRTVWSNPVSRTSGNHIAPFPESLITRPIKAGCPVGGIVLDLFMGSGTTAIVAERLGRKFIGIELNPAYIKEAEKGIKKARMLSCDFQCRSGKCNDVLDAPLRITA
jgi:site-specific DNA-methyltransferase (adenine-specific)